ncbi:hypothetical protein [Mycobacterium intracellulare]|uniref:Uncharacterized protein n=1 Tax=Mycobacterium intracellulare TaxID=1767 RepID=A0AAE4RG32_MYCIT|nr:hypothetical protein [Mycobacterium intracellulare]MDV6979625.1 hypothetical protein [Mycobacterium intracellulare]MDV6985128.1 hypothetical protein [Mycobacterium intracellulare]MDV7014252.1 hypothetical protein [Mycobacterium intracellulare]MDV7030119.1 hypothetical protein [Mycobacterium intracellulare]
MARQAYAHVCDVCDHLASRHYLTPEATSVHGPYACSHRECDCQISQSDPTYGITEATFNRVHLPHLAEYEAVTNA